MYVKACILIFFCIIQETLAMISVRLLVVLDQDDHTSQPLVSVVREILCIPTVPSF